MTPGLTDSRPDGVPLACDPPPAEGEGDEEWHEQNCQDARVPYSVLELREVPAEDVPEGAEDRGPADPPNHGVKHEPAVWHAGHAGEECHPHAQECDKSAEEDRLPAVVSEESASAVELGFIQAPQPAVAPNQCKAAGSADPIAAGAAGDGADGGHHDHGHDRERACGGVCGCRE